MKNTGTRIRRSVRRGWLAGLAAASIAVSVQAETPRFSTRGATPPARTQASGNVQLGTPQNGEQEERSSITPATFESFVAGAKKDAQNGDVVATPNGNGCGNGCGNGSSCCDSGGICDNLYIFGAVNAWKGPLDSVSENSFGLVGGFNAGAPLWKDCGLGFQFGMSYGIYDFNGRDSFAPESEPSDSEHQLFFTTGVFHRCVDCCNPCASIRDRISWGLVYDYMITANTGAAAAELNLGQIRYQIGYACDCANEVGVQGSFTDTTEDDFNAFGVEHSVRSIDQVSVFWHHVCECNGLDTRVYTGWAENLGEWVIGASATMPINDCWSLYGGFTYIKPSADDGPAGSSEEFWNVTAGFAYYPGGNARATSVCRPRWMPLLPVADNGSFAMDLGR